jgi:hypothetical protein
MIKRLKNGDPDGPQYRQRTLRKRGRTIHLMVKPLSLFSALVSKRRIFTVAMRIVVAAKNGLKRFRHKLQIELEDPAALAAHA